MKIKEIKMSEAAKRAALATAGITAHATPRQLENVSAEQNVEILGNVLIFIRNPRDETVTEMNADEIGLIMSPTKGKMVLPQELSQEDKKILARIFGR